MTREHAIAFINSMNAIIPFVPPMYFNAISASPVMAEILAAANTPVRIERASGSDSTRD